MKQIFLDYASTTPLDPRVEHAMRPYTTKHFGNPSALYKEGLVAKAAVQESREKIAKLLNIRAEEIVFTGSGTEADNLALLGIFYNFKKKFTPHFITTVIEHPGILETMKFIEQEGGEVSYIGVDESGIVDPQKIAEALKPTTVLVTIMYANNEIGTIQPIRDISRVVKEYRQKKVEQNKTEFPYIHTDASQAANYLDLSFQKLGVEMMTLDASKIYGPKGIGLLAVLRAVPLKPMIHGGGQEKGLRAGTENVPAIVGMTEALSIAQAMKGKETERLTKLRDYFFDSVIKLLPNVSINGDRNKRLPNNVNICVPELDAEFAVIKLDHEGISCSSASSCMNLSENSYSYVVEAINKDCRESSLRFSLGRATTKAEISLTLKKFQSIIKTL
ncbi:MAG: cysteine desulfurase NifS, cysteine desulfurase [Candidatus Paceibacter sp.]|jgi:cysteine desulfurase|nr:cysteine desulfurase NifS, cysteine desulfurase [Candidatus Paceibacter sp.]